MPHHLDLVQDDDIGELDLIDHEVGYSSLILGGHVLATGGKELVSVEVIEDGESINDGNAGVELGEFLDAAHRSTKELA